MLFLLAVLLWPISLPLPSFIMLVLLSSLWVNPWLLSSTTAPQVGSAGLLLLLHSASHRIPKHLVPRCIQDRAKWAMRKWGFMLFKRQGICSFFRPWFGKAPRHMLHFRSSFIALTCRPVVALMIKYFPELVVLWPLIWRARQPSVEDPYAWWHSPRHACTGVWIHVCLHLSGVMGCTAVWKSGTGCCTARHPWSCLELKVLSLVWALK